MTRRRTINQRNTSTQKKSKKGEGKKFREKSLHEHGMDAIYHILKKLSQEDGVRYFCCKAQTPKGKEGQEDVDMNEVDVLGSEAALTVRGRATIGLWTQEGSHWKGKDGQSGHEITYSCDAKVVADELGQKRIQIGEFEVNGLDECPV